MQTSEDPRNIIITADRDTSAQERAAAIAETQLLPNVSPTTATAPRRTGGSGGGSTRGNRIADEAVLAGEVQIFDEAGQEVQRLFQEFLNG